MRLHAWYVAISLARYFMLARFPFQPRAFSGFAIATILLPLATSTSLGQPPSTPESAVRLLPDDEYDGFVTSSYIGTVSYSDRNRKGRIYYEIDSAPTREGRTQLRVSSCNHSIIHPTMGVDFDILWNHGAAGSAEIRLASGNQKDRQGRRLTVSKLLIANFSTQLPPSEATQGHGIPVDVIKLQRAPFSHGKPVLLTKARADNYAVHFASWVHCGLAGYAPSGVEVLLTPAGIPDLAGC
jgi:hypothetical protein